MKILTGIVIGVVLMATGVAFASESGFSAGPYQIGTVEELPIYKFIDRQFFTDPIHIRGENHYTLPADSTEDTTNQ